MKIKLAILENDQSYLSRIVSVFSTKYSDKFQVYSFTDYDMALSAVSTQQIEVLIANTAFDVNTEKLPKKCAFAYFVDSTDIDTVKGQVAICKFQKAELIYKQILSIYSEKADSITGIKMSGGECRLTVFSSPCGGCGTSSVAAASLKRSKMTLKPKLKKILSPTQLLMKKHLRQLKNLTNLK